MNLRSVARVIADLIGKLFRLLPRRKRFGAARRLALVFGPLVRRTAWYPRRPSPLDGHREETMRMLLRSMTRTRVPFDLDIVVRGGECVPEGPALIVSGHLLLNLVLMRWLHDRSYAITVVVGGPREPLYHAGTNVPLDLLYVSPLILIQMHRKLAAGRKVFLDLDVANPHEHWIPIDTAGGRRHVSPVAPRFAERLGIPIVFTAARFDSDGRVILTFARPSSTDANVVVAEFCDFLIAEVAQIAR